MDLFFEDTFSIGSFLNNKISIECYFQIHFPHTNGQMPLRKFSFDSSDSDRRHVCNRGAGRQVRLFETRYSRISSHPDRPVRSQRRHRPHARRRRRRAAIDATTSVQKTDSNEMLIKKELKDEKNSNEMLTKKNSMSHEMYPRVAQLIVETKCRGIVAEDSCL